MEEEVLSRLVQRIRRVRPQFQERGRWFLLHDNARSYTAVPIKQCLAKQVILELNHPPPYSPDLSPRDFFLVPKNKSTLKGEGFGDTEDIKGM
jgi:histone-lysine N-methyltransferase SETMAR